MADENEAKALARRDATAAARRAGGAKGGVMDWDKAASLAMPNAETFRVTGPLPEAGVIVFMRADSTPNITIRPTGEVELAPGLEISEASRLFWQGLADAFPAWRAEVIAAALAERKGVP